MEGNKIYFKDLFDPDVLEGLARMKETLGNVSGSLNGLGEAVKAEASKVQSMMSAGNQSTEALAKLASTLERLCDIFDKWKAATDANKEAIEALKTSTKAQVEIDKEFCSTEKTKQALIQTETALLRKKEVADRIAAASAKKHAAEQKNADTELKKYTESLKKLNSTSTEFVSINGVMSSSFKELSAAYSATVAKMKDMAMAGDTDSKTFQSLATSAMMMHDKLDSINKSVGIYTMNVGNYKAAFDGLGFSLQQILREAPSAINLQQFFLAISNNIPLFMDQLARTRAEIPKIKKDLDTLDKKREIWVKMRNSVSSTAEQVEKAEANIKSLDKEISALGKKTSVFKAIATSIFSWQTAILGVVFVISKYGVKIINWAKSLLSTIDGVRNSISKISAVSGVLSEAEKNSGKVVSELLLIQDKLSGVTRGSEEWKMAIERVNELTHSNLKDTTATIEEVKKVTDAYIEQARQLAINQAIIDKTNKSDLNKSLREKAYKARDAEELMSFLGIEKYDSSGKETKAYKEAKRYMEDMSMPHHYMQQGMMDRVVDYVNNGGSRDDLGDIINALDAKSYTNKHVGNQRLNKVIEFINFVNKHLEVLDTDAYESISSMFKIVDDPNKKPKNPKNPKTYTKKDTDLLERRAYEVEADNADDILERRIELIKAKIKQELFDTKEEYDKELSNLLFNNEHDFLGKRIEDWEDSEGKKYKVSKEFLEQLKKLNDNYTKVTKAKDEKEKLLIAEETKKQQIKIAKDKIKEIQKAEDIQMAALKNRVKTEEDEIYNNSIVIENMKKINLELERLKELKASKEEGDAGIGEIDDAILKTTSDLDKMQQKLEWDKQLALPKNLGDVTGIKKWFSSKTKGNSEGILRNALGDEQVNSMSEPQRESAFNTWLENSIDAMGTWYNTSVGYIKDVMDAYVELQQAKVEAAEEATDAAKEQYESEKALMEAGYANNMESAYKEYKEKQALQKKAEEESKRAQKAQLALDSVSQSSSLITAAAQLWQSLSAIPVVGSALAIAAISTMFGSFAGAKIMAAKATKYGDGTAQLIDYGGSHASGNDVPLGVDKNGNEERIERGEIKAVINRRAVGRLGASRIIDMINSMNDGTFVEDAVGTTRRNLSLSINSERPVVNLSNIEKSLGNIERSENEKRYIDGDFEVVKIGNYTKRIRRK